MRIEHRRARLHGELIERQVRDALIPYFGKRLAQFLLPGFKCLTRARVDEIE